METSFSFSTNFMLPFKITPELNTYSPNIAERVLQKSVVSSGKYTLFMQ